MPAPHATHTACCARNENLEGAPVAPELHGGATVSVLAMLAAAGAVVGLWAGARRYSGPVARGYRWLGGAALFWLVGLIVDAVLVGPLSPTSASRGLAGLGHLVALGAASTGIMVLASASPGTKV